MKLRKNEILTLVLILATFVMAYLVYPALPERMASHWGLSNNPNGHLGKFWGVFLLPTIILACFLILTLVPRADPKKENIEKFRKYYDLFLLVFVLFFVYIYSLTIFWNLGYQFIFIQYMAPALAVLFYFVGVLIGHAEPNLTIGIRTPWTLASDDVWYKTHKLGGKLFQAAALIMLLGIFFPQYAFFVILVPLILVALYLVLYSYLEFRKK